MRTFQNFHSLVNSFCNIFRMLDILLKATSRLFINIGTYFLQSVLGEGENFDSEVCPHAILVKHDSTRQPLQVQLTTQTETKCQKYIKYINSNNDEWYKRKKHPKRYIFKTL